MHDDNRTELKVCCRCYRETPGRLGKQLPVKGRGGVSVKRFLCPECAARRGKRVPPIASAIPNRTIDGLWNWGCADNERYPT